MPTLRQLSRMLFPTPDKGGANKTKKNGRPVEDRAKPNSRPASVGAQAPRTTRDGYPLGERRFPKKSWVAFIEPLAYIKLMTWYQGSHGLELSGYALLSEPVNARLDQETYFHVQDLMLVCAIQESSGGYTEMSAEQRVRAMMQARELGYKANQLGWWHHHPVNTWSSTDLNTLRQRVHELGLPEVLQAFAFVLTPRGILARWDQSGPKEGDNVYVDEIPVVSYAFHR